MNGVVVLDNTQGQLIDFDAFLARYPSKMHTRNNWGSAKHTKSVDYLFNVYPDGFVLMDSDVLVKRDISEFFDDSVLFVGKKRDAERDRDNRVPRLLPFLCGINVKMCVEQGVRYFDKKRNWKLRKTSPDYWYDTGASFLEDCLRTGLPVRYVDIDDYIIHFYGGSYKNKDWRAWLDEYSGLWKGTGSDTISG